MSPCGNERIVYDFHMRRGAVSARAMTILRYAEASALDDNVQWRIMPRPRSLRDHSHLNLLMVKSYAKVPSPVAAMSYVEKSIHSSACLSYGLEALSRPCGRLACGIHL